VNLGLTEWWKLWIRTLLESSERIDVLWVESGVDSWIACGIVLNHEWCCAVIWCFAFRLLTLAVNVPHWSGKELGGIGMMFLEIVPYRVG